MAEENKAAAQAGTSGQPQQAENKSFFAKYGGSIIQMIFFWIVMKAISGGKISKYIHVFMKKLN
jgi:hypothetical protein